MMVLAGVGCGPDWDWAKWLPHTRDATGAGRMLSADAELSTAMVEARLKAAGPRDRFERRSAGGAPVGPTLLVVVDDESLTEGRRAPTRNLLRGDAGPVAGIVVASTADRLPAVCTTVVEITDPDGVADLILPQRGDAHRATSSPSGMADDVARDCARSLARFEDPELDLVGAGLPATIRLLPLLELDECTPEAVAGPLEGGGARPAAGHARSAWPRTACSPSTSWPTARTAWWAARPAPASPSCCASMVAGLAAIVDPDHLTFVLVDFKGGSAFDECAKLPHTVGMVTDLDEHLAERALRCLEAELKHRERTAPRRGRHRPARLPAQGPRREPMPRLLVIIDEFATLKAELPEFIDALVGRGPAGPQPRRPHAARHPAPAGRDQRQHPGQHQPAHRPAGAGR